MTLPYSEPLVAPGRGGGLLSLPRWRYLLRLLVRKELRVRYRGSALGMLWSYVKPAVQFLVFYFAVGVFLNMNSQVEHFAVYLFSGIIVINLFSETFGNATRSIVGNSALVKKIFLPRELFPLSSLWVAGVHFLPQVLVLLAGCLVVGYHPGWLDLLAFIVGMLIISGFALGLGLLFGALNVMYRDAENFVDLILMVATWTSPVLYQASHVVEVVGRGWIWWIYQVNPITSTVNLFHAAFWRATTAERPPLPPDFGLSVAGGAIVTVVFLVIGQLVFRSLDGRFAQEL